jgi:hypothetical protein
MKIATPTMIAITSEHPGEHPIVVTVRCVTM